MCKPLCETKEIRFTKCLGAHLLKLHVFEAEWDGQPVIIKSIRPYKHHRDRVRFLNQFRLMGYDPAKLPVPASVEIAPNAKLSSKQFIEQANATLFYGLAGKTYTNSTRKLLEQVILQCDLHGDGILEKEEIEKCWRIIETEEYVIATLLEGHPSLFHLLGICGELYAEDFATPLDSLQYLGSEALMIQKRSWKFRAKLALAILDMLDELEKTPYGPLHYCDVKESNIGIVESNGRLIAKSIDLDSGWFGRVSYVEMHIHDIVQVHVID